MSEKTALYNTDEKTPYFSAYEGEQIDAAIGKVLNGEMDAASVVAAQNAAIRAKSYSEGGTGTREGENENNAKYYMNLARATVERFEADNEALVRFENTVYHIENVEVPKSLWKSDSTYAAEGFGYAAVITILGVTEEHFVEVVFAPGQSLSGNILTLARSGEDTITIYATGAQEDFTIPNIVCILGTGTGTVIE